MDIDRAWKIVKKYGNVESFSEEEMFLYEEALNYILQDALAIKYYNYSIEVNVIIRRLRYAVKK